MEPQHPLDSVVMFLRHPKSVGDRDPADDEHSVIEFHLSLHIAVKVFRPEYYLARFQRAGKGAGESAARGGDHVVDGCCVRLEPFHRVEAVVPSDGAVDPKMVGSVSPGIWAERTGPPNRRMVVLDTYTGPVMKSSSSGAGWANT